MGDFFSQDKPWNRALDTIINLLVVGILWLLCSVPIITIGAATTAAYYTMVKSVKKGSGYLVREYFQCFKTNFWNATIFTMMILLISVVVVLDIVYLIPMEGTLYDVMQVVVFIGALVLLSVMIYLFPNLSRFQMNKRELLKLSVYMAFRYLPRTLGVFVLIVISLVLLYLFAWLIPFLPGIFMYLFTIIIEPALRKSMPKPEEGSLESEKWYYR